MCNILRYNRGQRRAAGAQELSVTRSCHQEPSLSRGAVTMSVRTSAPPAHCPLSFCGFA